MKTQYPIIGFHRGIQDKAKGIKSFYEQMDGASRPFALTVIDDRGMIDEATDYKKARNILVFRHGVDEQGRSLDTPLFRVDASHYTETAADYTARYLGTKGLMKWGSLRHPNVYLGILNECDENQSEWLAEFCLNTAKLFNSAGIKTCLLNWATGSCRYGADGWRGKRMIELLRYVASAKDGVGNMMNAIGCHEYSLDNDLFAQWPHLVSRPSKIIEQVCQENGIGPVMIVAKEFGYHATSFPSPEVALKQIDELYDSASPHFSPLTVRTLWCTGPKWEGTVNQDVADLIAPLTAWAVSHKGFSIGDSEKTALERTLAEYMKGHPSRINLIAGSLLERVIEKRGWERGSSEPAPIWIDGKSYVCRLAIDKNSSYQLVYIAVPKDSQWREEDVIIRSIAEIFEENVGEIVPPQNVLVGLHGPADPAILDEDRQKMRLAAPTLIKVMSHCNPIGLSEMVRENPDAKWIVRAFLSMGGRVISPQQFFEDTISDVRRTINVIGKDRIVGIELHNEPNLLSEGLEGAWANGAEFNRWLLQVLGYYRRELPNVPLLFPALSPGGDFRHDGNGRSDSRKFYLECLYAARQCDGIAAHAYWSPSFSMEQAIDEIVWVGRQLPDKPLWITEASSNGRGLSPQQKVEEYIAFPDKVSSAAPMVHGICYFVLSASNPVWSWANGSGEVWTEDMARDFGNRHK